MTNKKLSNFWSKAKFDKPFFILILIITIGGFLIFLSATLGLQARDNSSVFKLIINQAIFGLIGGSVAAVVAYNFPLRKLKEWAVPLFIISLLLTVSVFIPGLGFSYGGATRWLDLGPLSLQPAELLKLSAIILAASWFSFLKQRTADLKLGLGGVIGIIGACAALLIMQPDTGTIMVIIASVGSIYLVAGAKWRHIALLIFVGILALATLVVFRPYVKDRLITFINPTSDPLGDGYQTHQSMIAVGSGLVFGRGPGQSIQKFNYLPEPVGDSIFAVFAEEYGFMGSIILLVLYAGVAILGYRIASQLRSNFEKLLVVGLVTMIVVQSLLNIGAMVGVFPLSGMPLIFISHGGTALLFSLAAVGLILQASTNTKKLRKLN